MPLSKEGKHEISMQPTESVLMRPSNCQDNTCQRQVSSIRLPELISKQMTPVRFLNMDPVFVDLEPGMLLGSDFSKDSETGRVWSNGCRRARV